MPNNSFILDQATTAAKYVGDIIGALQREWLEMGNPRSRGQNCMPPIESNQKNRSDGHPGALGRYRDILPDLLIDDKTFLNPNVTIENRAIFQRRK